MDEGEVVAGSTGARKTPSGRAVGMALLARPWASTSVGLVVFLAAWQVASLFYPPFLLPGPLRTVVELWELFARDNLLSVFLTSIQAMLLGLGIAIPAGIVLGFLTGAYPMLERAVGGFLDALYVTPTIMLIPLFIIWFGIGTEARIAYILVVSYFPIVVNTFAGVRATRGEFTETARAFQAGSWAMFRHVYLPGSLPFIMAGIRLAVGRAIVAMITAEMFLAIVGLGAMVVDFGNRLATGKVLAVAVFVSLFGIAATEFVKRIEQRIAPWSFRPAAGPRA